MGIDGKMWTHYWAKNMALWMGWGNAAADEN
jgi:hypothetical protein